MLWTHIDRVITDTALYPALGSSLFGTLPLGRITKQEQKEVCGTVFKRNITSSKPSLELNASTDELCESSFFCFLLHS